jgi:hypothetical protein
MNGWSCPVCKVDDTARGRPEEITPTPADSYPVVVIVKEGVHSKIASVMYTDMTSCCLLICWQNSQSSIIFAFTSHRKPWENFEKIWMRQLGLKNVWNCSRRWEIVRKKTSVSPHWTYKAHETKCHLKLKAMQGFLFTKHPFDISRPPPFWKSIYLSLEIQLSERVNWFTHPFPTDNFCICGPAITMPYVLVFFCVQWFEERCGRRPHTVP